MREEHRFFFEKLLFVCVKNVSFEEKTFVRYEQPASFHDITNQLLHALCAKNVESVQANFPKSCSTCHGMALVQNTECTEVIIVSINICFLILDDSFAREHYTLS